jgi:phosphohistidine phosphatase
MDTLRRLYVLRHAKSSWDDPGQSDFDRPLAPRGRRAVKLLARYVEDQEIHPDLILCSTARRTRETLEGVKADGSEVLFEDELYGASCSSLIERLQRVPPATRSVMVVGHNPASQMLVLRLARDHRTAVGPGEESLPDIRRKFPTGALATLELDVEWRDLAPGTAELTSYVRPKALLYQ